MPVPLHVACVTELPGAIVSPLASISCAEIETARTWVNTFPQPFWNSSQIWVVVAHPSNILQFPFISHLIRNYRFISLVVGSWCIEITRHVAILTYWHWLFNLAYKFFLVLA